MWQRAQRSLLECSSMKYHTPDTWHDIPPSHIILTLSWPVLIPSSIFLMLSAKRKSSWSLVWLGWGLNSQPPVHKADALPTEPQCRSPMTTKTSNSYHKKHYIDTASTKKTHKKHCCYNLYLNSFRNWRRCNLSFPTLKGMYQFPLIYLLFLHVTFIQQGLTSLGS